jgi:hypothetical protein
MSPRPTQLECTAMRSRLPAVDRDTGTLPTIKGNGLQMGIPGEFISAIEPPAIGIELEFDISG